MKIKKLKVGIAGFGIVGSRRRQFIDQNPFMITVAISDIKFKNNNIIDGIKYCSSYKDLFDENLDVLFVCLPNYLAADATINGLQKGLHVFCEKPPGKNVFDILKVIRVEKRYPKLKLKYGFNHRYHDSFIEACNVVKSKKFGKLVNIRGIYGKSKVIPFDGGWRSKRRFAGGGILLDQGIHMLDMIRYLAGDFNEVYSFISNDYWKHDVEDNAYSIMRNSDGCVAMIHSTATQWQHRFRLELTLEEAIIELTGILSGTKSYGEEKLKVIPRNLASNTGSFDEISKSFLEDNSWKREVDEFADIIIKNKKVTVGNSKDAFKVMDLVQRIYFADNKWRKKHHILKSTNKNTKRK